jgi:hypothetical protein
MVPVVQKIKSIKLLTECLKNNNIYLGESRRQYNSIETRKFALTEERGREKSEKLTVSSRVCSESENWDTWHAASRVRAIAVCGRIGPFTKKKVQRNHLYACNIAAIGALQCGKQNSDNIFH